MRMMRKGATRSRQPGRNTWATRTAAEPECIYAGTRREAYIGARTIRNPVLYLTLDGVRLARWADRQKPPVAK